MNLILVDGNNHQSLLPLTYTKPASELRIGILTLREKWKKRITGNYSWKTEEYLQSKFPCHVESQNLLVNSTVCASDELVGEVLKLELGEGLQANGKFVAAIVSADKVATMNIDEVDLSWNELEHEVTFIQFPWDIHENNGAQLKLDFELLTKGRKSQNINTSNHLANPENIFVEEGAKIEFSSINASAGPVYIGRNAEIMEGSLVRGPFALLDHSVVNMGSKIYGATTVGPFSKVGGEINQSVIEGYSNKGHDGFLGHSVLGEWCNLGAGTNVSNLKNTYDKVKVWSYADRRFVQTGLQFSGLIMGDHSKAGINTMFNTGTVVGVGCNIHGANFPRQFVPSFADGGAGGYKTHLLKSVFFTAKKVMARRGKELTIIDQDILQKVFEQSVPFRRF
ncbi:GlmU family protein [Sunxiuqinia sp. A32]|uniref:GlmU family protein n=1 Tax=Sunxiuqinia sp. A32 TaxID=3461496 RepID=UPI0040465F75